MNSKGNKAVGTPSTIYNLIKCTLKVTNARIVKPTNTEKPINAVKNTWLVTVKPKGIKPNRLENNINKNIQKNKGKYFNAYKGKERKYNFNIKLYNNSKTNCQEFEII